MWEIEEIMSEMKRMILCVFPMSVCNFRCPYCYLTKRNEAYTGQQTMFKYSPEHVGKAFTKKRLGGVCYFNFCADGETLLQKDVEKYIYEVAKEGHFIEIVTNLTVTPIIDKILSWDSEIVKRIEFKCSFHYLELKKRKLLNVFTENVKKIWSVGCSANIEITPADEYLPYIDEIKKFSLDNFGALPHLSIARDDSTKEINYLTDLNMEEYDKIWGSFNSDFWKFKKEIFGEKRREYCYAGMWSLFVNMENGDTKQCYYSRYNQNIFDKIDDPIDFIPIGKCKTSHCYNGHSLLTLGLIPELKTPGYGDIRDRIKNDGNQWLNDSLKNFFNSKLSNNNNLVSIDQKKEFEKICRNHVNKERIIRVKNKFLKR